jgi:superfamily II DNA or RNA helicase
MSAALDEFTLFDLAALPSEPSVDADTAADDAPAVPQLRPYQQEAVAAAVQSFATHVSTLIAMATGTGKTVCFAHLIEAMGARRTMILAHREELIDQAVAKVEQVTGTRPAVEKGESWADCGVRGRKPVVVSSIQTQLAKSRATAGKPRMHRFDPMDFDLLIIDEGHHAVAKGYRLVIDYYTSGNPNLKVLLVTATPDRGDGKALGKVCQGVAYRYPIYAAEGPSGITDGWLVEPRQRVAPVDGLDLSHVSVTAGELNGKELAATLEFERVLHGVACVSIESSYELPEGSLLRVLQRTGGEDLAAIRAAVAEMVRGRRRRQTLIFCKSVKQAERVSEIVNRWLPDAARWVSGDQQRFPRELRRNLFRDFGKGRFGFLSNVGVCTEGTDIPGVEVVVVARPTLSRALYEQMVGRGTRPHESIAHSLNRCADAAGRRAMIAMSPKPSLTVVDMAGNAGRHKLVMLSDLLGGDYSDDVRERAKKKAAKLSAGGVPADIAQLLRLADEEVSAKRRQRDEQEQAERSQRERIVAAADYRTREVDPFGLYGIKQPRDRSWHRLEPPTQAMVNLLRRYGIDASKYSKGDAGKLISQLKGKLSKGQAEVLIRANFTPDEVRGLSPDHASRLIDKVKQNGWRRPDSGAADPLDVPVGAAAGEV